MNKELVQLKKVIRELIHQLKTNVFYRDTQAVAELGMADIVFDTMSHDQMTNHIVRYILPHADQIKSRNQDFFNKNRSIFSQLPDNRVQFYADYFMTKADKDTLDTLWKYFEVILALVEAHKKRR